MRVLLIPDSWGWAYDFYARGVKTYSEHEITICAGYPKDGLTIELINANDLIFCFSRTIWNAFRPHIRELISTKPLIMWCCGSSFAPPPAPVDVYAVCTEKLLMKSRELGIENVVLLREGVDPEVYRPTEKTPSKELRVGWAGNKESKRKRAYLLEKLCYPVKTMTDHDKKFRVKGREREPMVRFYNSLDVYITLMKENGAHGVGRPVLEAMSCGLPVIATDICSTSKAVPERWLIPSEPDDVAVREANKRLRLLDGDRGLLAQVGEANRKFIIENYSWEIVVKDWDRMFEEVKTYG